MERRSSGLNPTEGEVDKETDCGAFFLERESIAFFLRSRTHLSVRSTAALRYPFPQRLPLWAFKGSQDVKEIFNNHYNRFLRFVKHFLGHTRTFFGG